MSEIVVIGAGFAACAAVRALRRGGHTGPITLVAPRPVLVYYPSLVWVPSGRRTRADLETDLQPFLHRHRVTYRAATVTGLDPAARRVRTSDGEVPYDYLIIGSGSRYLGNVPGIEHAHVVCEGWEATQAYSERLAGLEGGHLAFGFAGNPSEPAAMRGGVVFEFLFGVDTLLRRQGRRERFTLSFFTPAAQPGGRMGDRAVNQIMGQITRRGIQVHVGRKLKAFEPGRVVTEGGEIPSDLTLFLPGMTGPVWAAESGLAVSAGGFLQADEHCRAIGPQGPAERVYVAGDAGSFPGPDWRSMQAHMADIHGKTAANNVLAAIAGRSPLDTFPTELVGLVDTLDGAILVYRTARWKLSFSGLPLHWAKIAFEWMYLRPFRAA